MTEKLTIADLDELVADGFVAMWMVREVRLNGFPTPRGMNEWINTHRRKSWISQLT